MLQCSFLHCLSICKLLVVFFCTVCPYVNCEEREERGEREERERERLNTTLLKP